MSRVRLEFVSDLVDATKVSVRRLSDAVSAACPQAWEWCARDDAGVAHEAFCTAVVDALPDALRITWPECLRRAGQAGLPRLPLRIAFAPLIEIFDGTGTCFPLPLVVVVYIDPLDADAEDETAVLRLGVRLAVGQDAAEQSFFERDCDVPWAALVHGP